MIAIFAPMALHYLVHAAFVLYISILAFFFFSPFLTGSRGYAWGAIGAYIVKKNDIFEGIN
uniref:Uncharacterized protein n=1 Tax=Rhizophora mucronata TaxID=61149 RepID=A0A2P2PS74_RHIMU